MWQLRTPRVLQGKMYRERRKCEGDGKSRKRFLDSQDPLESSPPHLFVRTNRCLSRECGEDALHHHILRTTIVEGKSNDCRPRAVWDALAV